ncbi:MAG: hypothetical protein GC159_08395 [Phycisphaera sp.]|nr:hypothetical protein [Phycisphaera sp.]
MNAVWKVLNIVKQNPLIVVCVVVIVCSAVSFVWPTRVQGTAFVKSMESRSSDIGKIKQYFSKSIVIPAENPDDPPRRITTVIKPQVIEAVQQINQDLQTQYTEIFKLANEHNRAGHEVMLQGLFPAPVDQAKPYNARGAYLSEIVRMYHALKPGQPLGAKEIQEALAAVQEEYVRNIFPAPTNLSDLQLAEIAQKQAEKLVQLHEDHARSIGVYVTPLYLDFSQPGSWNPGPFVLGKWAQPGALPPMGAIWEGQMQLWVQQDLVRAIRLCNDMDKPGASVLTAPIKNLVSITMNDGTVGKANPEEQNIDKRLPDNFKQSHTGRTSNPLYDVRQATMVMHVDTLKIPQVINAISKVNFMTVLGIKVTNVDEYEALRAGYHYGGRNVSQVELTVETLWMRQWITGHNTPEAAVAEYASTLPADDEFNKLTDEKKVEYVKSHGIFQAGLMPDSVRASIGLAPRDPNYQAPQNSGGGKATGAGARF